MPTETVGPAPRSRQSGFRASTAPGTLAAPAGPSRPRTAPATRSPRTSAVQGHATAPAGPARPLPPARDSHGPSGARALSDAHRGLAAGAGAGAGAVLDTPEQLGHALWKRAKRVAVGKPLARALVAAARGPLMGRAYARTAEQCGSFLDQQDGKVRQYWCGSRWCPSCAAIRTARAWAAYGPAVRAWGDDAYLVTLTIPNVTADALRPSVKLMHARYGDTVRSLQRRFGLGSVEAIRATECTYSDQRAERDLPAYHPHSHVIVRGKMIADALVDGWLQRWPDARRVAQDVRRADAGATSELFKYSTKIASDRRAADGSRDVVPVHALDVIFTAFRGLRLWQATGVTSATADDDAADDTAELAPDVGTDATTRPAESIVWHWQQSVRDWVDPATGECLTGYEPSRATAAFLEKIERMADDAERRRDVQGAMAGDSWPSP